MTDTHADKKTNKCETDTIDSILQYLFSIDYRHSLFLRLCAARGHRTQRNRVWAQHHEDRRYDEGTKERNTKKRVRERVGEREKEKEKKRE